MPPGKVRRLFTALVALRKGCRNLRGPPLSRVKSLIGPGAAALVKFMQAAPICLSGYLELRCAYP